MSVTAAQPVEHELDVGERVRVRQARRPIPELVGHVGTIVEVFRVPRGSCLVRIDGDPDPEREWLLYRDEIAIDDT